MEAGLRCKIAPASGPAALAAPCKRIDGWTDGLSRGKVFFLALRKREFGEKKVRQNETKKSQCTQLVVDGGCLGGGGKGGGGHDMQKTASTNSSVKAATSPSDVKSFKSRGLGDTSSLRMSRMVEDLRAGGPLVFFFIIFYKDTACVCVSCLCERLQAVKVTFEGHFSGAGGCQGSSVSPKEPLSVIGKLSPFRGSDMARRGGGSEGV